MPIVSRNLNVLARCGNQFRNEHLKPLGLTAVQAPYILHICSTPGLSQDKLARRLHVNPSNATRQLALLEEGGYVRRQPASHDRRQLEVYPLQKALDVCVDIRQVNALWNDYLTQGMTPQELVLLEGLLDRLRQRAIAWDEERGDAL